MTKLTCKHCDHPGGRRTYENQVSMPINGRVQCIDHCIHRIVAASTPAASQRPAAAAGTGKCQATSSLKTAG